MYTGPASAWCRATVNFLSSANSNFAFLQSDELRASLGLFSSSIVLPISSSGNRRAQYTEGEPINDDRRRLKTSPRRWVLLSSSFDHRAYRRNKIMGEREREEGEKIFFPPSFGCCHYCRCFLFKKIEDNLYIKRETFSLNTHLLSLQFGWWRGLDPFTDGGTALITLIDRSDGGSW